MFRVQSINVNKPPNRLNPIAFFKFLRDHGGMPVIHQQSGLLFKINPEDKGPPFVRVTKGPGEIIIRLGVPKKERPHLENNNNLSRENIDLALDITSQRQEKFLGVWEYIHQPPRIDIAYVAEMLGAEIIGPIGNCQTPFARFPMPFRDTKSSKTKNAAARPPSLKFPLVKGKACFSPKASRCSWCKTRKPAEPNSFAVINGGALTADGQMTSNVRAFLSLIWHGAHDGKPGKYQGTSGHLSIADNVEAGQFDLHFCSFACLRAFLNHCVDKLEQQIEESRTRQP